MINALELYRQIKGEWDKTSQPLKERGIIANRDTSGWSNIIDLPEDHPTISWARGINALGGLAGGVGKFGAEVIDSVLPLGTYDDGSTGLAVPSLIQTPIDGLKNFGRYGFGEEAVPYNSRMAFDASGGAMTGGLGVGLAGGMVDNAVGSAGGKLTGNALERAQPQGIRAYHGSPHDFDKFSLGKIGTGEGAQAYGHGLYFAESEDVARSYRDNLTTPPDFTPSDINKLKYSDAAVDVLQAVRRFKQEDPMYSVPELRKIIRDLTSIDSLPPYSSEAFDELLAAGHIASPGRMYEVNIKANPEEFLDWDKPLSQQSEKVRQTVLPLAQEQAARELERMANRRRFDDLKLQSTMGIAPKERPPLPSADEFAMRMHGNEIAQGIEDLLREAGIPGIKYLDGMSRGAGEGSSNFVVFDDALIDILRKYANAPTGAAIPMGLEAQGPDKDPAILEYLRTVGLY